MSGKRVSGLSSSLVALALIAFTAAGAAPTTAEPAVVPPGILSNAVSVIDLPTVLQLAGTRNLDVQIAREKLAEAKANSESATWQFFPAIIPGVGYRRHDDLIQDVAGNIIDVHKDSYTVGPTIAAQLELGDAVFKKLAAQQLVTAAGFALESQRQESALAAARGFFDLLRAQVAVRVAEESLRIATDFAGQVRDAVAAGVAFKGDALRAEVQADKSRLALRQAQEQVAVSAARLQRTLHLASHVVLVARDEDLVPLNLVSTNAALETLVTQAFAARPELSQSRAVAEAARKAKDGAKFGPLIPNLGALVFLGGLGGSHNGVSGEFGESEDYQFTLGWRVGPGGLFDRGRVRAGEARLNSARLASDKVVDEVIREVVESQARLRSQADQLGVARHAVDVAAETLRLTSERREFAVGAVLERVQAEQDLTRARLDHVNAIAEFDKAQFEAMRAVGGPIAIVPPTTAGSRNGPGRANSPQ
jgi:outer membrane protein TolC